MSDAQDLVNSNDEDFGTLSSPVATSFSGPKNAFVSLLTFVLVRVNVTSYVLCCVLIRAVLCVRMFMDECVRVVACDDAPAPSCPTAVDAKPPGSPAATAIGDVATSRLFDFQPRRGGLGVVVGVAIDTACGAGCRRLESALVRTPDPPSACTRAVASDAKRAASRKNSTRLGVALASFCERNVSARLRDAARAAALWSAGLEGSALDTGLPLLDPCTGSPKRTRW